MQENNPYEIKRLFTRLTSSTAPYTTSEHEANSEKGQQGPIRLIDVHIYDLPSEDAFPNTVESTLDTGKQQEQSETPEPTPGLRKRRFPLIPLLFALSCLLLVMVVGVVSILPMLAPSATVTIIPISQVISTSSSTVTVVAGKADPIQQQIPGRMLATLTMSQAQTVATTGKGHQDARAGHGLVTFYNGAPYAQTILAGTLLTGKDGIQIVTDQDATVPAATPPTFGQASVLAHAVQAGPAGNIPTGDVYGLCCRMNIFATNAAFTGGQNARDYQTVTQADIDGVAATLKTSLAQSVQAALQGQVRPDETLMTPVACKQTIATDHQAGEEATQVSVTVNDTCTGETYNTKALQTMTQQLLTKEATKRLGDGYSLVGNVATTIKSATPKDNGTIALVITCTGTWTYQFDQDRLQQIKGEIAGKSKEDATTILLHTPGVQTVAITLKNGTTLPADTSHIQIVQLFYVNQ